MWRATVVSIVLAGAFGAACSGGGSATHENTPAPTASAASLPEGSATRRILVRETAVSEPPPVQANVIDGPSAPYSVYQSHQGDTVEDLAAKFGLDPLYIRVNNLDLCLDRAIRPGESMIIPQGNGLLHEVRYGETLADIAIRYNVAVADIETANQLQALEEISEGRLLFVPNAKPPASIPMPAC